MQIKMKKMPYKKGTHSDDAKTVGYTFCGQFFLSLSPSFNETYSKKYVNSNLSKKLYFCEYVE